MTNHYHRLLLNFCLAFLIAGPLLAEGTRELSPNGQITVVDENGDTQTTTDIAALNIGNREYNYFARFNTTGSSRLNIFIKDAGSESIYLGFSQGHENNNEYGNDPDDYTPINYKFYVYDPAGNIVYESVVIDETTAQIQDWQSAFNGPNVFNPDGYEPVVISSAQLTGAGFTGEGNYYIEFEPLDVADDFGENTNAEDYLLIDFFDITVSDNSSGSPEERKGRLWSNNWGLFAVNDYGFPNRPFNGSFHVCAPDPADADAAYVTKIDFDGAGFFPGGFNIAFNSFGIDNSLSFPESAASFNFDGTDPTMAVNRSVPEYEVFLNDPVDRCEAAEAATLALDGISRCDGMAEYCIQFNSDKPGIVRILLDFDGQDDTRDREIIYEITEAEIGTDICADWDGLDGLGEQIEGEFAIVMTFEQGRYNFPIYDAELLENGYTVESVRPAGPDPILFYDDRAIPDDSGTGEAKDRRDGCNQRCHTWNTFDGDEQTGYGNLNTINTWWFSNLIQIEEVVELPAVLTCELSGPDGFCDNEEAVITLTLAQTPEDSETPQVTNVEWDGPGIVDSSDDQATVNVGGTYTAIVDWLSPTGEACSSSCSFDIEAFETPEVKIDTTIEFNSSVEIGGVVYDETTVDTLVFSTVNGCDSTVVVCVTEEIPDVLLTCELSGPDGICMGDTGVVQLTTIQSPVDGPVPVIDSIVWSGSGIVTSSDTEATVEGGNTYTVTIYYTNELGARETSCETTVDQFPTPQVKIDTTIEFDSSVEIGGVVYDETTVDTLVFSTVNGCDSTVVVCVTEEIPDVDLVCTLSGPDGICMDETGVVQLSTSYTPANAPAPVINSITWTGTGIVSSNDSEATVQGGDEYTVTISYTNLLGEEKSTSCELFVDQFPTYEIEIDTVIEVGQVLTINGEEYDMAGEFVDEGQTTNGCDSIVIIRIVEEAALICYDLDDCKSIDYTRFTPKIAEDFDCADVTASTVYRVDPERNGHSCTEGVNGSVAMCVSSVETCEYEPGSEKSVIIDVVIQPLDGNSVRVSSLSFYERAPEEYYWTNDRSGINDYPTLYGVRVLKNGNEIFRTDGEATSFDWTLERYSFSSNPDFVVDQPTVFRFELLGYCTIGADSYVTAWDLDDIKINASCAAGSGNMVAISGEISDMLGSVVPNVELSLNSSDISGQERFTVSGTDGRYAFENVLKAEDYVVTPELDRNHLKGVTTADIIHIQRHILGLQSFTSPYQMVAADIDRSNSITARDLLELRKLILGVTDNFVNNKSYRFGYSAQELDVDNPWVIEEKSEISNVEFDRQKENFRAIKVGDVSMFNNLNSSSSSVNKNLNEGLTMHVTESYIQAGETAVIAFESTDVKDLKGIQMSLDLGSISEYSLTGLGESGITHYYNSEKQLLNISWITESGLQDGLHFELQLNTNRSAWVSDLISVVENELPATAYLGEDLQEQHIDLNFVKETGVQSVEDGRVLLSPNPFTNVLNVYIESSTATRGEIEIVDVAGRSLYRKGIELNSGTNSFEILKSDIQSYAGMMLIRITHGDRISVQRVVTH